jgi:hypothetical protein
MAVSLVKIMTNNNEPPTMNYSKQTQSNPISPATPFGGFIRLRRIQIVQKVAGLKPNSRYNKVIK